MEKGTNTLNWFEIPVTDFDRARKFYGTLYGVEMNEVPAGGTKMSFLPVGEGGVGGALVLGEGYEPSMQGSTVYLNGGEDLDTLLSKVEPAGGKVVVPKSPISPEWGFFAIFIDSEGNKIGLHSMK